MVCSRIKIVFFKIPRYARKILLGLTGFIMVIMLLIYNYNTDFHRAIWPSDSEGSDLLRCYENNTNNIWPALEFENIPKNTSFFFLLTSCQKNYLKLKARQVCSIESAALLHPSSKIYLLIPSPIGELEIFDQHTKILLRSYKNIKFLHINMTDFFKSTPLEEWYAEGKLKTSRWPVEHASDILRFITVWKYGGTYVDLDVVFLKSLEGLSNFAGVENYTENVLSSCLFSFTHGHLILDMAIRDIRIHFNGLDWANNGPGVITRALLKYCNVTKVSQMDQCTGITVYPPKVLTPFNYTDWKNYFIYKEELIMLALLRESLAVHFWNKLSHDEPVIVGSGQMYDRLAAMFCPRVYSTLGGPESTF